MAAAITEAHHIDGHDVLPEWKVFHQERGAVMIMAEGLPEEEHVLCHLDIRGVTNPLQKGFVPDEDPAEDTAANPMVFTRITLN